MGVDFVGAAEDMLDELEELGEDYLDEDDVGALIPSSTRGYMQRRTAAARGGAPQLSRAMAQTMVRMAKEMKRIKSAQHERRVFTDAQSGKLPQIFLGVSTAGVTIAAGATLNITAETNTRLRVTDFFVDDAVAADFVINDIQISRLSLFAGNLRIPASSFVTSVQRPPLEAPILPSGTELSVSVTNRSGAPRAFDSMFTGLDVGRTYDVTKPR